VADVIVQLGARRDITDGKAFRPWIDLRRIRGAANYRPHMKDCVSFFNPISNHANVAASDMIAVDYA